MNAKRAFDEGGVKVRKQVAQLVAADYILTLGNLEITPHPYLVPILSIEPPESSSGSHKEPSFWTSSPAWLHLPDAILTLIHEKDLAFPALVLDSHLEV